MSVSGLRLAGVVLEVVKDALGCSVETVQVSTSADGWIEIVIADADFTAPYDSKLLAGAICGRFAHKMRYVGPVTHEGGTVTIVITRPANSLVELRVSGGV